MRWMVLPSCMLNLKTILEFKKELHEDLAHFVGRPTPLYLAERLTAPWVAHQFT